MISTQQLKEFVEANPKLVTRKESARYPGLFVLKYKHCVFYDNLWTPELRETRGLVVDADWNIVVHPFTKIFNRGENGTDFDRDDDVIVVRKVNGFMACVTRWQGENLVSTTGSLDSDYVTLAEKWVKKLNIHTGFTYIFEICDPEDPHIIAEQPGAYLIGMRELVTGDMMLEGYMDLEAPKLTRFEDEMGSVFRPDWFRTKFSGVVQMVKRVQHEGFVVYGPSLNALKIKSPYYLATKFLARKREDRLSDLLSDPARVKQTIDEEFYPLIDFLHANVVQFTSMNEQQRITYIKSFLEAA